MGRGKEGDRWAAWSRVYPAMECLLLGRLLGQARARAIPPLRGCHRVLLLGDGDGRFLEALWRGGYAGHVVSIDLSPAMTACARRRLLAVDQEAERRVEWICADLRDEGEALTGEFDGVVAQFFFDNFSESSVASLVRRVGGNLTADAVWAVSDFVTPESLRGWRRIRQRLLLRLLYAAFRHTTGIEAHQLPAIGRLLEAEGWQRTDLWTSHGPVVAASTWTR